MLISRKEVPSNDYMVFVNPLRKYQSANATLGSSEFCIAAA